MVPGRAILTFKEIQIPKLLPQFLLQLFLRLGEHHLQMPILILQLRVPLREFRIGPSEQPRLV